MVEEVNDKVECSSCELHVSTSDNGEDYFYECCCIVLSRSETSVEPNIQCACTAENKRYGIKYRCRKQAQAFFSGVVGNQFLEQSFCSTHSEMLRQHRLCLVCYAFCTEGELKVCNEFGVQHWMHADCYHSWRDACCHCDVLYSASTQFVYFPYKDPLFEKIEAVFPRMTRGLQLNALALCDDETKAWLIAELNMLQSLSSSDTSAMQPPFHEKSQILLHELWETFKCGRSPYERRKYYLERLKFAAQCYDQLSLLIILQFVDLTLDGECLLFAVEANDAFAVRVLLHHGAPVFFQKNSGEEVDTLNIAFRLGNCASAEEILKFLNYRSAQMQKFIQHRLLEFINHHDYRAVDLLIAYGANIYERDRKGKSVFHKLAKSYNHLHAVIIARRLFETRMIIASFLDVEDYHQRTALQLACTKCNWKLAE